MASGSVGLYQYGVLSSDTSFRVVELQPGQYDDIVTCTLHTVDWKNPPPYEAISYAWGDANARAHLICDGKELDVTKNLVLALKHLRYTDRSRHLWADAVCINQSDIPERNRSVARMLEIYQKAQSVIVYLGQDSEEGHAKPATEAIEKIANFLHEKLQIPHTDGSSTENVYQELMLKNAERLPSPNECDFGINVQWKALVWFYSHLYFTRVWPIQEVQVNKSCVVHCGHEKVEWDRVDMVASYILAKPIFSKSYGFTETKCWWAATIAEMSTQPRNWIATLYLATNYFCLDQRDRIYGLLGLMDAGAGKHLLEPDYNKSLIDVYRDAVEAAFLDQRRTDILLYVAGTETPSWIARWDVPMLFRNPFRFGKAVPWKPAGTIEANWSIDRGSNILSLSGFVVGSVESVAPYNQRDFCDTVIKSDSERPRIRKVFQAVLEVLASAQKQLPLSDEVLTAAALSFSFGQDDKINVGDERDLLHRFTAFLRLVLDEKTYQKYVPGSLAETASGADGHVFGKPVWDFDYPPSTLFVTADGLVGCSVAVAEAGDTVFVALGSTYPFLLRPHGKHYSLKGYIYAHRIMHGERKDSEVVTVQIQ